MEKVIKLLYVTSIVANVSASIISFLKQDYVLGLNQLLLALFIFLYIKK
jgi:hypothetical protein